MLRPAQNLAARGQHRPVLASPSRCRVDRPDEPCQRIRGLEECLACDMVLQDLVDSARSLTTARYGFILGEAAHNLCYINPSLASANGCQRGNSGRWTRTNWAVASRLCGQIPSLSYGRCLAETNEKPLLRGQGLGTRPSGMRLGERHFTPPPGT